MGRQILARASKHHPAQKRWAGQQQYGLTEMRVSVASDRAHVVEGGQSPGRPRALSEAATTRAMTDTRRAGMRATVTCQSPLKRQNG